MKEGDGGGGSRGAAMGGELQGEGHGGAAGLPLRALLCFLFVWMLLCVALCCAWQRKETGGRRRREEKKKNEKKKKYGKKFKLGNF
jgi:hypothetical protein